MRNRTLQKTTLQRKLAHSVAVLASACALVLAPGWQGWQPAQAATTDIASLPVFTVTPPSIDVKPNVFLILDDSGSMGWTYMPDETSAFAGKYGYASHQCNGVYYNPAITYTPPVDAAGNSFTSQSFTNASNDGYGVTTTGSTNLSTSFKAHGADTAQAAYYYTYSGTQTTEKLKDYYTTTSTFYRECNSNFGSTPGSGVFTKVVVSATSGPGATDERTNFANWYAYYRTRINMMKSATGLAFKALTDRFRVGFMSINNNTAPAFLNVADFNSTQKAAFYAKLYGSNVGSSTPLRAALSTAGRLYANKISSINGTTVTDPLQYSCQQNYTILSTDGQWNESDSLVVRLDGTTLIGNQDGALPRPYNDGSQVTTTTVTPYTSIQDRTTTITASTATITWSRTNTVIGASCSTISAPSNTAAAPMNVGNSRTGAIGYSTVDPDGSNNRCFNIGGNVWFCRSPSGGSPAVSASSATGTDGVTWYLVSNIGSNTGCKSAQSVFGSAYSATAGICPQQGVTGKRVTVTPQTQLQTISGYQSVQTDRYSATQTTTQTTVNGVPGPVGAMTPATPSYTLTTAGTPSITGTTYACGGISGATEHCPETSGTWTSGTPNPNNQCVATADLPTAGASTATASSPTYSGQNQSTAAPVQVKFQDPGTATVTSVGSGGVANTLADVAAYYYGTDLRSTALGNCTGPVIAPATTPNDLCADTVPANGVDTANWQHMSTFTLGLGVRGRMIFSPSYLTDTTGDYTYIKGPNATTASSSTCSWRDTLTVAGGACNWPVPGANKPENTDDLWHAAVNGRGNYFSATDPTTLTNGLTSTLKAIINTPRPGTAAAAATTNPRITSANNFQFSSYFETRYWAGELIRQTINLADGTVPYFDPLNPDPTAYNWSAQVLLNAKTYTTRNIYTNVGGTITPFTWANLSATQKSFFTAPYITTSPPQFPNVLTGLSQFCSTGTTCISATAQTNTTVATNGAAGEALVNFLRGDRTNEETSLTSPDNAKFYRYRKAVLGDIVSAQPQWVGAPSRSYSDTNYTAFKTLWANRTPLVYAAANDGMLHAFDSASGQEMWAYVPSFSLPRMYTLADKNYPDKHQYFVEGTPVIGDICSKAPSQTCTDAEWQTILVGGMNAGGTGYYALDITNPASPKLLWEFTDANMGLTFGRPQITKLDDGRWVVMMTSGYNNCPRTGSAATASCVLNGTGDGMGYLYILNAATGTQVSGSPISTGFGSVGSPSGLAQIAAHADANNVTKRVYAGDLYGNVWRFNVNTAATTTAPITLPFTRLNLAVLKDSTLPTPNLQPIMDRPQITTVDGNPVVYVGTGRYLGVTDVGTNPKNSFYAIRDDLLKDPPTTINNPRADSTFIGLQAITGTCPTGTDVNICQPGQEVRLVSQVTGQAGDSLQNKNGWYLDFPAGAGEIQFTDPKLVMGTVAFTTSVPAASTQQACTPGQTPSDGQAYLYMVDYLSGGAVGTTSRVVGTNIGAGVATTPQIAVLPNGQIVLKVRLSGGMEVSPPARTKARGGKVTRVTYREVLND